MIKEEKILINVFVCDLCGFEDRTGHQFNKKGCTKCHKDICEKCIRTVSAYLDGEKVGDVILFGDINVTVCKECFPNINNARIIVTDVSFE